MADSVGIKQNTASRNLFILLGVLALGLILTAVYTENLILLVAPFALLVGALLLFDYKKIYYLLFLCLPVSTEYYFPNGLATDLPTEPIMWLLLGAFVLYLLLHGKRTSKNFFIHPLSLFLYLHFTWIFISSLGSENFLISVKFTLAKTWYIIAFYFFSGVVLQSIKNIERILWLIFFPLMGTVCIILFRHYQVGFSFSEVNSVLSPFYRNKVNYASFMICFFPYLVYLIFQQKLFEKKWIGLVGAALILLVAINYTYTRAAYVALVGALGFYFVIRFRLTKFAVLAGIIGLIGLGRFLTSNNKYLDYAPDFKKTVYHDNFDKLLNATYKLEDISTMERVYRWVAAYQMIKEKPVMGYGPGNFYTFYKSYTVNSFETYVSDNPEQSGVHSYFLMTFVEQGAIGFIFFLAFCFFILLKAEQVYHRVKDRKQKGILMAAALSLVVIFQLLIINDMLETDKVGSFFFLNIAVIVIVDLLYKKGKKL